jgi:hypothetical protein
MSAKAQTRLPKFLIYVTSTSGHRKSRGTMFNRQRSAENRFWFLIDKAKSDFIVVFYDLRRRRIVTWNRGRADKREAPLSTIF